MKKNAFLAVCILFSCCLFTCDEGTTPSDPEPELALSSSGITFGAEKGGTNPAGKNVAVTNSGTGTLSDIVSPVTAITYGTGQTDGWLTVTRTGTGNNQTLLNAVIIDSLNVATYTATVSVFSEGAINSPQTYAVTLTITPFTIQTKDILPADLEVDSCEHVGETLLFDTTNLYEKIDGYDIFFLSRGFLSCAYQTYEYPNPKLLTTNQQFGITVNEMRNADSAKSVYDASIENKDTVQVLTGIGDEALIMLGSWNYGCFMRDGKYVVEFDAIYFDSTTGAQEAIKSVFSKCCTVIDQKIP